MKKIKFVLWCKRRHNWRPSYGSWARDCCSACAGIMPPLPEMLEGTGQRNVTKQDHSCPRSPGGDKSQSGESSQDIT